MAAPIVVPTLSSNGWVTNPANKADALLAYFYESMKSQTLIYGNNVSSIQHIIQEFGSDVNILSSEIQKALERYLGNHYDVAIATVTNSVDNSNNVEIKIHCSVSENGITYSIGNLLKISNSKITAVMKINNG